MRRPSSWFCAPPPCWAGLAPAAKRHRLQPKRGTKARSASGQVFSARGKQQPVSQSVLTQPCRYQLAPPPHGWFSYSWVRGTEDRRRKGLDQLRSRRVYVCVWIEDDRMRRCRPVACASRGQNQAGQGSGDNISHKYAVAK